MSQYKMSPGPRGRKLYFKENEEGKFKMISVKDIPQDILDSMELQKPLDDQAPEFRKCIFCGMQGTEEKTVNQQRIYLCLMHYDTKTTGEVAQQIREGVAV